MPPHPLHKTIADLVSKAVPRDCTVVKDPACGGDQRIPLFRSADRCREQHLCCVDLLVIRGNQVRLIVEIEESNIKPTQIAGKFLTSALSSVFIHDKQSDQPIPLASGTALFQVISGENLSEASKKPDQCEVIEASIKSLLPIGQLNIYRLFIGNNVAFESGEESDSFGRAVEQVLK